MRAGLCHAVWDRQDHLRRLVLGHRSPGTRRRCGLFDLLGSFTARMAIAFRHRPRGCYTQVGFSAGTEEYFLTSPKPLVHLFRTLCFEHIASKHKEPLAEWPSRSSLST